MGDKTPKVNSTVSLSLGPRNSDTAKGVVVGYYPHNKQYAVKVGHGDSACTYLVKLENIK